MDGGWDHQMQVLDPTTDSRGYRSALGAFATGVTIVTTDSDEGPVGITVNSFSSVSLDPPLVLWSPAKGSNRFRHFAKAQHFAIHVLHSHQRYICEGFARSKTAFDGLDWEVGKHGVPIIGGCLACFECDLEASHDAGDHVIQVGRVRRAAFREGAPLLFQSGKLVSLPG